MGHIDQPKMEHERTHYLHLNTPSRGELFHTFGLSLVLFCLASNEQHLFIETIELAVNEVASWTVSPRGGRVVHCWRIG